MFRLQSGHLRRGPRGLRAPRMTTCEIQAHLNLSMAEFCVMRENAVSYSPRDIEQTKNRQGDGRGLGRSAQSVQKTLTYSGASNERKRDTTQTHVLLLENRTSNRQL